MSELPPNLQAGSFGAAVGLWRNLTNRLFDLEANILVTASATEKQSTVVKKLQQKVRARWHWVVLLKRGRGWQQGRECGPSGVFCALVGW